METGELRLTSGLELLARGASLFRRTGMRLSTSGGASTLIAVNGQRGRLTGRSTWRLFEVAWDEGEQAGERSGVRVANIVLREDA